MRKVIDDLQERPPQRFSDAFGEEMIAKSVAGTLSKQRSVALS